MNLKLVECQCGAVDEEILVGTEYVRVPVLAATGEEGQTVHGNKDKDKGGEEKRKESKERNARSKEQKGRETIRDNLTLDNAPMDSIDQNYDSQNHIRLSEWFQWIEEDLLASWSCCLLFLCLG